MPVRKIAAYEANGVLYASKLEAELALLRGQAVQILDAKAARIKAMPVTDRLLDELLDLGWPLVNVLSALLRKGKTNGKET